MSVSALTFWFPGGGTLKVGAGALASMRAHIQLRAQSPEAGGVLVGRLIAGSQDVVIDLVTPPLPKDKRSRYRIDRLDPGHQRLVDEAFERSGGTYLGEWHTHPEPHPMPSGQDLRNWRRKGCEDIYYGGGLVFIILGTASLGVWCGDRLGATVNLMATASYADIDARAAEVEPPRRQGVGI